LNVMVFSGGPHVGPPRHDTPARRREVPLRVLLRSGQLWYKYRLQHSWIWPHTLNGTLPNLLQSPPVLRMLGASLRLRRAWDSFQTQRQL
jgi:hypothetical protein